MTFEERNIAGTEKAIGQARGWLLVGWKEFLQIHFTKLGFSPYDEGIGLVHSFYFSLFNWLKITRSRNVTESVNFPTFVRGV